MISYCFNIYFDDSFVGYFSYRSVDKISLVGQSEVKWYIGPEHVVSLIYLHSHMTTNCCKYCPTVSRRRCPRSSTKFTPGCMSEPSSLGLQHTVPKSYKEAIPSFAFALSLWRRRCRLHTSWEDDSQFSSKHAPYSLVCPRFSYSWTQT